MVRRSPQARPHGTPRLSREALPVPVRGEKILTRASGNGHAQTIGRDYPVFGRPHFMHS